MKIRVEVVCISDTGQEQRSDPLAMLAGGLRVASWGALAMAVTAGVGPFFGTAA